MTDFKRQFTHEEMAAAGTPVVGLEVENLHDLLFRHPGLMPDPKEPEPDYFNVTVDVLHEVMCPVCSGTGQWGEIACLSCNGNKVFNV